MNRKTSTFTLMLLAVAIALIPSVYAEYPIENMVIVQDLPENMVAGSSYEMIITFDNVAQEPITPIVKITVTSQNPIIGYNEIFIDEINLNGFDLMYVQEPPGVFTTVEGTVAASSHNELSIITRTAINLMPGVYTFEFDMLGEEIEPGPEPGPTITSRGTINRPPVADAGPNQTVDVAQMVEFSGINSIDPDGYLISWTWDFGDGTEASGVDVSHRYLMGDNYTVTLTVVDFRGGEDTDTCTVTVMEHVIPVPLLPPFLDNLTVIPLDLELGDNVTIGLDIMNPNDGAIGYGFDMEIGVLTLKIWVELEPYESKTVSRTVTPTSVGTHNVTVIGMTGNFTVKPALIPLKPAEFVVSDLTITPEEFELGEGSQLYTFKVTVDVTNVGEQEGTHTVDLFIDGLDFDWSTVTLGGGESTPITFDVTSGVGSHLVEVDGLTGSFVLKPYLIPLRPAEFVFSNLEMTPDENLTITISVNATNDGEETGNYTVRLKLNTVVIDSEEVTLEGGESITTSFGVTRDAGTYTVEVEGLTGTFTIAPTEEQPFWWTSPGYVAGVVIIITSAGVVIYYIWKGKLLSTIFSNPK